MSTKKTRCRLDARVQSQHPELTRAQIQSYIMQGNVTVDGQRVTKSGTPVKEASIVQLSIPREQYVSRAGYKLAAALDAFRISVVGKVALDAGISTGGFTDCLFQRDIARVYGIDVGKGLVHEKVKEDPRLVLYEQTNLRYLETLPEKVDLVTLDLSFISVLKVMNVVKSILKPHGELLVLIKPQFEAGREQVGRGGIVSDPQVHQEVIERIKAEIVQQGFVFQGVIPSPLLGASGNQEFLAYFRYFPS
jgi:23S rRNA (cytidine1920-2'-O)/16S rRNA (cytidine1409-2'-O)-methyltransferase